MIKLGKFHSLLLLASLFLFQVMAASAGTNPYTPPPSNRVDFNFNYDWKFIRQNVTGASATNFNDSTWQAVSLPHTWNDDKFREWIATSNSKAADPLRPSGTYYGIGWYRKHFTLDTAYTGRKVFVEFQGICLIGVFYINGQSVGINESGVGPAGIDITPYVNYGGDNIIAVEVNNSAGYKTVGYNGAALPWGQPFNPSFGGLNRDVVLHIMDKLYATLPLYRNLGTVGTYVYPTPKGTGSIDTLNKTATINVESQVENDYATSQSVTATSVVVDATGTAVLTIPLGSQTLAAGQIYTFKSSMAMTGCHFWDPTYPYLYKVYTTLSIGGTVVDVSTVPLGIRTYSFANSFGLQVNGHPIFLAGYAPRCSMEWPDVGTPVDWMNEYDFQMIKASNANFMRPMHIAPRKVMVEAADKFGIVMVCPAANNEGDDTTADAWQQRLDDMRDVTIYFRNNPSVLFYEGCNQILSAQHMTDMVNIRKTWDPNGGRLAGCRSMDTTSTEGIREYGSPMDVTASDSSAQATPAWDAEYARAEGPRRLWDKYTPMYNPRWDGVNSDPTPFNGTNTTSKYLIGGYFNIASDYHQAFGLNSGNGDFIGDYLVPSTSGGHAYFRLQTMEDMILENTAKYYARLARSTFIQTAAQNTSKGVMIGGAKIIWSDSVTDGRMHDMEVTRTSGAVDGVRLPKELYYAMQAIQNPSPQVFVVGHWNYTPGTVKTVYVVGNTSTPQVGLKTYDANGGLIHDYGMGTTAFFPTSLFGAGSDQVNGTVFEFTNVAWQPGSIKATGYSNTGTALCTSQKTTVGAPVALKMTPTVGPSGDWMADGRDIAWFDVEVVDANGNRCQTFQDNVTFNCSGEGVFLGGYNSGIRYSTNLANLTSGYNLQIENGINRVFVRATRNAGSFTLNVASAANSGTVLTPATSTISSVAVDDTNGLSAVWPQKYTVALGTEPTPVTAGVPPPPPPPTTPTASATDIVNFNYSGGNDGANVVENVQAGQKVYVDETWTLPTLPSYLTGGEFIQPYQSDAGATAATDQYQFNLTDFSYIYLAIDSANAMPLNDNNDTYQWQLLPETFQVNGRTMKIYRSRVMQPYENGYFADNGYGNSPFDTNSNMYLVFVTNIEQQVVKSTDTVSATSTQSPNLAPLAIDGNTTTRWAATAATFPQVYNITLDKLYAIGGYDINWYSNTSRDYQYKIELSADNTTWYMSLDNTGNKTMGENQYRVPAIDSFVGKYVRITITGASAGFASMYEVKINGVPATMVAPSASGGPVPQSVVGGQPVTLTVNPIGMAPFTYQWLLNGQVIDGATSDSYTIPSASVGTVGDYSVVVTNAAGSTTIDVSNVTLDAAPPASSTDTPTLPPWAFLSLALFLFAMGQKYLARNRPASGG